MLRSMAKVNTRSIPKNTLPFIAEYASTDSVIGNVHGEAAIPKGIPSKNAPSIPLPFLGFSFEKL